MRLADRLKRLEGPKSAERHRQKQIEVDAAEFDHHVARRSAQMSNADRAEAKWGWIVARQMLRHYPGSAAMFAGMLPEDLRL